MVRCRGALRPEVVSAERKSTLLEKNKVPPELPLAPPPVPPRKLRHPRGLADGEANPSPVKKSWDSAKSVPTSQNGSPQSQSSFLGSSNGSNSNSSSSNSSIKSSAYESCYSSPKSGINAKNESPKALPKDYSSDLCKFKQVWIIVVSSILFYLLFFFVNLFFIPLLFQLFLLFFSLFQQQLFHQLFNSS